ncbi:Proteinase (Secreted protein) [Paramicrosporidium saccamoebae]|uniref:Proteinase (Secreted protein) n=1 Tax=Paramicrosporidium saccamoebae TaxID=1246581 RepID=A0A2H9TI59_9FUNG|nr:Proteinase (Secreted protein) [Paramicrosporidium saccamoebae]
MGIFLSLLFCILPIACSGTENSDIQSLSSSLNKRQKSVSLSDNFRLSPELATYLTLDGAKTLFEILLGVPNYDKYTKPTTIIDSDKEMVKFGPLTDEIVSVMGPDVCALFVSHYQLFEHSKVTVDKCISIFIKNIAKPEYPRGVLQSLPVDWFTKRPVELLNALTAKQLKSLFPSRHNLELNNPNNCQGLTVAMALKLINLNVIPGNQCISKITDLDTMECGSSLSLISSPEALCYYNGPLSKSVTTALLEDHLHNYASKVKGDIICQNLHLEFARYGHRGATARCLHGYFHAGPKPLDISQFLPETLEQWLSKYPSDVQNLNPMYLGSLPYSCWKHILGCKDNLNREFLKTIAPNTTLMPTIILDLPPEDQKLIKEHAPPRFLKSVHIQFTTESLLEPLNDGCHETANQMVQCRGEYPSKFFSGLTVTGARTLLCASCGVKDYGSFLRSDSYLEKDISLEFTDWIRPEQVSTNPKVCAVFLHAVKRFKGLGQISMECWGLHLNELIEVGNLNKANFNYFPPKVLRLRAADLFVLFKTKGLRAYNFQNDLVKAAIEDPKACSRMKLDYFRIYPQVIIPPKCVARLADIDTTEDGAFKNLGPDAFSHYDGPLSDALLKKITKDQLASFGAQLDKNMVCNEVRLNLLAKDVIQHVTLQCIRGSLSKPTGIIGPSFKKIPDSIVLQWMQLEPQNFRNLAISDRPRIAQSVWMDVLQYPKIDLAIANQLFGEQEDIGMLDLPGYDIDEACLRTLLEAIPLLAHALMVRAKTLPVNLYSILGPQLVTEGITVCHQKRAGIHLFATLENVENAADIIANIPWEFCASLSKGEYLRYTWLRANFSKECRKHLQFPSNHLTPELSSDPHERNNGLDALKTGRAPRQSPLDLEAMLTDITWSDCDKKHCSKGHICTRGQLQVPSNYLDPEGGSFILTIYRYTQQDQEPRAHLIFLTGGPGGPGVDERPNALSISELTKGDVATYLVDHRGLGESGQFTRMRNSWEAETLNLKYTFANKKFDEKDLRLEPAALDIAMVGLAILRTHPAARLSIYGFSYGALWAHEAVRLMPNLFDSVVVGGMPALRGVPAEHNIQDILEHCKLDPFCRSKMGSDVLDTFPKMVEHLGDPETNQCVKMLHSKLGVLEGTAEERVQNIAVRLEDFVIDTLLVRASYANVQILLPLVKATIDCIDIDKYSSRVLEPLIDAIKLDKIDYPTFSVFVQKVVNADYYVPSIGPSALHPPHLHPYYYVDNVHQLPFCKYCLAGRNKSSPEPLTTEKTAFYFLQGLFDVQTPFNLAKQVFDSIKAPLKIFQPVNNRGHGGFGLGETEYIIAAVYGQSVAAAQQLVEKSAESRPMKWKFAVPGDPFSRLWSCVNDALVNEPVDGSLPKIEISGRAVSSLDKLP